MIKKLVTLLICGSVIAGYSVPVSIVSAEEGTVATLNDQIEENPIANETPEVSNNVVDSSISEMNSSEQMDASNMEDNAESSEPTDETGATEETTEIVEPEDAQDEDGYTEPSPASRSDLAVSSRSLTRATIDKVNAGEANRPSVSFIDVSSHNGTITTSQYKMMMTYGVKGVVVKLTEGTTYFNPYAQSQVANAKAAGLQVSVYHYSHYVSTAEAESEAAFFASKAKSLSLPANTVMVSDIEEAKMRTASVNANSKAFQNKLNSSGYGNVAYYLSRSWLDVAGGVFSTSMFGKNNIWVAQYPYTPTASQNWNSDFSSWQWSSNFYFPGIAHPFDINTDYTGLFTTNGAQWNSSIPVTGSLTVADSSKQEKTFKAVAQVEAGGYTPYKVFFPTWSVKNGQDDIVWYEGKLNNNGTWSADIDISKHNTVGDYITHAYVQMLPHLSANIMLGSSNFSVSSVEGTAKISNYNQAAGTFDVIVSGSTPSGINRVMVPVWSKANQSDIYWYEGVKQSNGTYKVTVNVKNHQYNSGVYNVHSYIYANNGLSKVIGLSQKVTVQEMTSEVSFSDSAKTEKTIIASTKFSGSSSAGAIKNVRYAVWSAKDDQDDLYWYTASKSSDGKYKASIDINRHKTAGYYHVHTYVTFTSGVSKIVSGSGFTIAAPTASVSSTNYNKNKGTFDIFVKASAPAGIKEVEVPVWSTANQNDIRWYKATKQSNGQYKVAVDIKNHKYNTGVYQAHAYVKTNNSLTGVAGMTPLKVVETPISGSLSVTGNNAETTYAAKLKVNLGVYGTAEAVHFATWSSKNGQDDIRWYQASRNSDGTYATNIQIANHKDAGQYQVHAYATLKNGTKKMVAATTFNVAEPTLTVVASAYNRTTKSFTVTATGSSKAGISEISIPVWNKANQSDLRWYKATKQANGTYKATIAIKNHGNATGSYNVHAYLYAKNGVVKVASTSPVAVK
ncbi:GBS Bsp-like repeat-containing protein [Candidatus Enterococcus clewellii]|uniref:Lysozyme n=1 Tax=Candidatus Enterococcus clewellii TaxID=1834193 RepID=A0A242K4H2_9ENTE|nr:GBS Bsp-like repeat-containing protein [Enterococcus sp. 9E7_DIV0242]OTP12867.1 hypothetical protein A5888_003448 [Enterococcus sp. 9E7_DIV0242]